MFVLVILLVPIVLTDFSDKPLPLNRLFSGQVNKYFEKYGEKVSPRAKLHILAKHGSVVRISYSYLPLISPGKTYNARSYNFGHRGY